MDPFGQQNILRYITASANVTSEVFCKQRRDYFQEISPQPKKSKKKNC